MRSLSFSALVMLLGDTKGMRPIKLPQLLSTYPIALFSFGSGAAAEEKADLTMMCEQLSDVKLSV